VLLVSTIINNEMTPAVSVSILTFAAVSVRESRFNSYTYKLLGYCQLGLNAEQDAANLQLGAVTSDV